jgi:hypothetical protein
VIDHVIMFKSEQLSNQGEQELYANLGKLLDIPGIVDIAIGKNFGERSRGFDYCMRVTFETREDLDAYEAHPIHADVVVPYNRAVTDEHICVDFEWTPAARLPR